MATYNGWTEIREYRVWMAEENYAVVTVAKHSNGWFHVYEDGSEDWQLKTRDEAYAFRYAVERMNVIETEACNTCPCVDDDCADAARNVYGSPHGVRTQVVDNEARREIAPWEL